MDEVERAGDVAESRRDSGEGTSTTGQVASSISRQIVQLHARLYGRGPTRAKTYILSDFVLSVLEDIFTAAERTLIAAGKGEHVFTTRRAFQEAVKEEFIELVENATGRQVRAFMSQVHLETQTAVELFMLEPQPENVDTMAGAEGEAAGDGG